MVADLRIGTLAAFVDAARRFTLRQPELPPGFVVFAVPSAHKSYYSWKNRQAGRCVRCSKPAAVVNGETLARCESCRAKRKRDRQESRAQVT